MEPIIEQANRALFEGNRAEVIRLLKDRARTGQELWLLASAVENHENRIQLLRRVEAIGELPYALLAQDMLRRERQFAEALAKAPAWQYWLLDHRDLLIRVSIAVLVISATIILLGLALGG